MLTRCGLTKHSADALQMAQPSAHSARTHAPYDAAAVSEDEIETTSEPEEKQGTPSGFKNVFRDRQEPATSEPKDGYMAAMLEHVRARDHTYNTMGAEATRPRCPTRRCRRRCEGAAGCRTG